MSLGKVCFNCKKGVLYGHEVSHAKNRTKRLFKPNLHTARVKIGLAMKKVNLCTKCLRKLKGISKKVAPKVQAPATVTV
jgi:large subunit ribosomal protein L28